MKRHLILLAALAGCSPAAEPGPDSLPLVTQNNPASPRLSGNVADPAAPAQPIVATGTPAAGRRAALAPGGGSGEFSLDFADSDVRVVAAQILGDMLGLNYTIDPAVHGSVTLHTSQQFTKSQLLPALEALLAQTGAALVQSEGLYRVVPAASSGGAGLQVIPLQFVSAEELAKVLTPLGGPALKVSADAGRNALLVGGDAGQRDAVAELVRSFDVDALKGQSYAVLPVANGSAKDVADALQEAFRGRANAALSGLVRVVALNRLSAVLVISPQPSYIDAARRAFALIEREERRSRRSWHALYLQNSHAGDAARLLQQAFTPNNVTAQPSTPVQTGPRGGLGGSSISQNQSGGQSGGLGGGLGGAQGGSGLSGGSVGGGGLASSGLGGSGSSGGAAIGPAPSAAGLPLGSANPLAGGLDAGSGLGGNGSDAMKILPDMQNNAILVFATGEEEDQVEGMLRKIDITPLQVRIDATIAEVDLNDSLQYGSQFFFKGKGINGVLNDNTQSLNRVGDAVLKATFPGFILSGSGPGGAPFALSALQAVTTVKVLSSPELTVVDNQPARLQVGSLVPYLSQSAQSTISSNAPIVNSVQYQPTGVILEVTPRVNANDQVTLDLYQEVSAVDTSVPTQSGINSPTFTERSVASRVVVQDGQTVGLAGLIQDNSSKGNSGIPFLKDIPLLGAAFSTQTNTRSRTELLVLITPHVIHDGRDMRAFTQDLQDALRGAAATPAQLRAQPASGSSDPSGPTIDQIRRHLQ